MTDPYKVLGVSPQATDDEIKKAYRALAKKYHPDNYIDNPLSDLAAEKMKEINEAYDAITKARASGTGGGYAGAQSGGTYSSYSGSSYSGSGYSSGTYARIRELLNQNRVSEAEVLLSRETDKTTAEWHFLTGVVYMRKGWLQQAREHLSEACRLDPSNEEYRNTLDMFSNSARSSPYNTMDSTTGCSGCDICTGLLCADLFCSCLRC